MQNSVTNLWGYFERTLQGKVVELNCHDLKNIIQSELGVIFSEEINKKLLFEAAPIFMVNWCGWSSPLVFQIKQVMFSLFREYMRTSFKKLITKSYKKVNKTVETTEKGIQTDVFDYKPVSQYKLVISGPLSIISNLTFLNLNDDIILKRHLPAPLPDITYQELLNWPFISVNLNILNIKISRSMAVDYDRYLCLAGDKSLHPSSKFFFVIEESNTEPQIICYKFLVLYIENIMNLLRDTNELVTHRYLEIKSIFLEFLKDIEVVQNERIIPINLKITYSIGNGKYFRVFGTFDKSKESIVYQEILTPKVQFCLEKFSLSNILCSGEIYFKDILDIQTNPSGTEYINFISKIKNDCISYSCLFCKVSFNGELSIVKIINHLKENHKNELPVKCYRCKFQYNFKTLAGNRWCHICIA